MKYTTSVTINAPIEKVVMLFDNVENYANWMEGLKDYTTMEGKPLKVGTISKLTFEARGRTIEMTEKVLSKDLPQDYSVSYDGGRTQNIVKNSFQATADNKTLYTTEQSFVFQNYFMKFFAWIMPNAFKNQSLKYQNAFKQFVESNLS